jgi:iron complex outermembrane receptor protein
MITRAARLRRILFAGCATLALSAVVHPAFAQDESRAYSIPSEDLGAALRDFGLKSGKDVVFDAALVQGKKSPKVEAKLSDEDALSQLLVGSGLRFAKTSSGSFVIEAGGSKNVQAASNEAAGTGARITETVVVTGTHLSTDAGVQGLKTYDRTQIDASGQRNVVSFLNTLPEVSQISAASPGVAFGSVAAVQLRGFPVGTTLVLLDGQRVSPNGNSSTGAFDVSNIPSPLVERVDVLPFGASAVYGSDAIAGVVNFVLKKDLDGGTFDASYGDGSQFSTQTVSGSFGKKWNGFAIGLASSYDHNNAPIPLLR